MLIRIEMIFGEKEIFSLILFDTVSYLSEFLPLYGLIINMQAIQKRGNTFSHKYKSQKHLIMKGKFKIGILLWLLEQVSSINVRIV